MSTPRIHVGMVRDAVVVAALAVLTVQALRRWIGDRYLVPSGSMEPLLHGDPAHGDIVFVDKLAQASDRRRGDVVVVRHPQEPGQQLVKRIACIGDDLAACWIDLKQGDVWLGDSKQHMQREVKDPCEARGRRAQWAKAPGTAAALDGLDLAAARAATVAGPWSLPAANASLPEARRTFAADVRATRRGAAAGAMLPEGCVGTRRPVDAACLLATGARSPSGQDVPVSDVGIDLAIAAAGGDVLATIETCHEALTFHWQPASGRIVLWRDGVDVATAPFVVPSGPASARRLEFGVLDNRVFCCFDGDPARLFVVPRPDAWDGEGEDRALPPRTLAHVAVIGPAGTTLEFTSLLVFRDAFVLKQSLTGPWPRHVPAGHWFLLGDNPFDSRDSRHFDSVPASAFLGRPTCIVGPWPRTRWVTP